MFLIPWNPAGRFLRGREGQVPAKSMADQLGSKGLSDDKAEAVAGLASGSSMGFKTCGPAIDGSFACVFPQLPTGCTRSRT